MSHQTKKPRNHQVCSLPETPLAAIRKEFYVTSWKLKAFQSEKIENRRRNQHEPASMQCSSEMQMKPQRKENIKKKEMKLKMELKTKIKRNRTTRNPIEIPHLGGGGLSKSVGIWIIEVLGKGQRIPQIQRYISRYSTSFSPPVWRIANCRWAWHCRPIKKGVTNCFGFCFLWKEK